MPRRQNEGRPAGNHRAARSNGEKLTDTLAAYGDAAHADLALRVAWCRAHADLLYDVDPSGQLSAQLRDLADLLEALDAEGRWGR